MLARFRGLPRFLFSEAMIKSVPGNKPPALADSPPGRYAGALFSAASERESLHSVLEDMRYVNDLLKQSQEFRDFVKNSGAQKQHQKEVMEAIGKNNLEEISFNFLNTLIEAGRYRNDQFRLTDLPKIIEKYQEYYKILNKEEDIRIISAKELTPEERTRVVESVKKGKQGIQFKITYEVDANILGGLQIYSGSTFLDCSLRSRLDRLRGELAKIA